MCCVSIYDGRSIAIYLPATGIYVFRNLSGIGKSYLGTIFNKCKLQGEKIVSHPTRGINEPIDYQYLSNFDIILFDRFDSYSTDEVIKQVSDLSTKRTILIDAKSAFSLNRFEDVHYVDLYLFSSGVVVRD